MLTKQFDRQENKVEQDGWGWESGPIRAAGGREAGGDGTE